MKFHLVRYFTATSLVAFLLVTAVLGIAQRQVAIANMLAIEESNNVAITRTFANSLWGSFAPFVARASGLTREALVEAPEQEDLRRRVVSLMRGLSVVKVKVYDLNGLTVFSTQASQIGEDKSTNQGFLGARAGRALSELTHRDSFSAFEETIENRDVLSSYIPIHGPQTEEIVGVFEIYKDVTPFLAAIDRTTFTVVGIVTTVLALLYGVLYLIVRRGARIIREQDARNTRTQLQLAQNEKMAALGQMVAGVAHELNTPLAFARSNLAMIKDAVEEFALPLAWGRTTISHVRAAPPEKAHVHVRLTPRVRRLAADYDHNISAEQLQQMLDDTLLGMEHIAELVINLRNYTRLDRAKVDRYNVNTGIETTLYIAKSAIPEQIVIDKNLQAHTEIRCMPSQVNQVILNLITNAAQALDGPGTIRVMSSDDADGVRIDIEDDGPGIDNDVLPHIFEPFFTTKPEGKGTGLGLSIVHDIVAEHGGKVLVETSPGAGTRFTILLPATVCDTAITAQAA